MCDNLLKTGTFSIVLGKNRYGNYFPVIENKLLKVTKYNKNHSEGKHRDLIRKIPNYKKYYSIPDEIKYLLKPSEPLYQYLWGIIQKKKLKLFTGYLSCSYVECAGNKELFDTISNMAFHSNRKFWKSYNSILKFCKQIMLGLHFLHQNQLCHLDIKPENIMVNTLKFEFRIVDFGFCSQEPFHDYVYNIRGTPGYLPKHFSNNMNSYFMPPIKANDFLYINGVVPIIEYRYLVYKIDSYCFGRVLYMLKYMFQQHKTPSCFSNSRKKSKKINKILQDLLEDNVFERKTITQCLEKYFPKNIT
jgi:serine/threonine protein kinase